MARLANGGQAAGRGGRNRFHHRPRSAVSRPYRRVCRDVRVRAPGAFRAGGCRPANKGRGPGGRRGRTRAADSAPRSLAARSRRGGRPDRTITARGRRRRTRPTSRRPGRHGPGRGGRRSRGAGRPRARCTIRTRSCGNVRRSRWEGSAPQPQPHFSWVRSRVSGIGHASRCCAPSPPPGRPGPKMHSPGRCRTGICTRVSPPRPRSAEPRRIRSIRFWSARWQMPTPGLPEPLLLRARVAAPPGLWTNAYATWIERGNHATANCREEINPSPAKGTGTRLAEGAGQRHSRVLVSSLALLPGGTGFPACPHRQECLCYRC